MSLVVSAQYERVHVEKQRYEHLDSSTSGPRAATYTYSIHEDVYHIVIIIKNNQKYFHVKCCPQNILTKKYFSRKICNTKNI